MLPTRFQKLQIEPKAIYSRQEAANVLGVSLSTLKRMINKGHLEISKPQGMRRIFITGESLQRMLDNTRFDREA